MSTHVILQLNFLLNQSMKATPKTSNMMQQNFES